MVAAFHFVAPSTDKFNFFMTAVDAHLYPLTDGAHVCVRELAANVSGQNMPCILSGRVDQAYSGPRDGHWQPALMGASLRFNQTYEFAVTWDAMRGGYVAVDALLVESQTLYNGGSTIGAPTAVVGPMDSRIFVKR